MMGDYTNNYLHMQPGQVPDLYPGYQARQHHHQQQQQQQPPEMGMGGAPMAPHLYQPQSMYNPPQPPVAMNGDPYVNYQNSLVGQSYPQVARPDSRGSSHHSYYAPSPTPQNCAPTPIKMESNYWGSSQNSMCTPSSWPSQHPSMAGNQPQNTLDSVPYQNQWSNPAQMSNYNPMSMGPSPNLEAASVAHQGIPNHSPYSCADIKTEINEARTSPGDFCRENWPYLSMLPPPPVALNHTSGYEGQVPVETAPVAVAERLLEIEQRLSWQLKSLTFGDKVSHVYNPLEYAIEPHTNFVKKFCVTRKEILFLGMNPGPFGMAQTGVPFGEAEIVRDWLDIKGEVHKPEKEHPKRPVWGLSCPRKEVSGSRLWGFLRKVCIEPEHFFRHCFVHNMCPLVFLAPTGRNLTPPDLPVAYRRPLNELCDRALCETVSLLGVRVVVGIGKYAQERAMTALEKGGVLGVRVHSIMHPSPANPAANKGWEDTVERQLVEMDVLRYILAPQQQQQQQQQVLAPAALTPGPPQSPPGMDDNNHRSTPQQQQQQHLE